MKAKFGLGMLLAALAVSGYGQSYRSSGQGAYVVNRDRTRIDRASITFNRAGTFSLLIELENNRRITFSGTAQGSGVRRDLRVTGTTSGGRIRGSGQVQVMGDDLRVLDVNGDLGNDKFSVKYTNRGDGSNLPGRPTLPPDGSREEAKGDTSGKGKYRIDRDSFDVKKITFSLRENGRLSLTVKADRMRDVTYEGRWSGRGDTRSFVLTGSNRGGRVSGSGSLKLSDNRKEIRSLDIDGRVDGDRLSLDFKDK